MAGSSENGVVAGRGRTDAAAQPPAGRDGRELGKDSTAGGDWYGLMRLSLFVVANQVRLHFSDRRMQREWQVAELAHQGAQSFALVCITPLFKGFRIIDKHIFQQLIVASPWIVRQHFLTNCLVESVEQAKQVMPHAPYMLHVRLMASSSRKK